MTGCTEAVWHICPIGDVLWHVRVVTLQALTIILERGMWLFMTLITLGNVSMTVMVTGGAGNIGMSTWMILDLLCLLTMTLGTVWLNRFYLYACQGCMCIGVTLETLGHLLCLSMRKVVAVLAVRHPFIPGKTAPEVVKGGMTEGTFLLVSPLALLDRHVNRIMTPGTLHRGQGFDIHAVNILP